MCTHARTLTHTLTHAHTLTASTLTRTGPRATTGGDRGQGTMETTHRPKSFWLERPEEFCVGHLESVTLSPFRSHQPKMGLLLADRWLRIPSPAPPGPHPEFAPNGRSPRKGVRGAGGVSSSATVAAASALPGVSVEVVLFRGRTGCSGSHLPHPEARQKGFLGKQKETKCHTVSPPRGHPGGISLRPQRQEDPVFLRAMTSVFASCISRDIRH